MKCRHKYVRSRWIGGTDEPIATTTYQCVACLALGVRSLGETPDPVGMELHVALFHSEWSSVGMLDGLDPFEFYGSLVWVPARGTQEND